MPLRPNTRLVYSTGGEVLGPTNRPDEPSPSPARNGVRIRLDRRASGRVVTVVTGLPGSSAEVGALAKALKSTCGAGGTVKDYVLEIQGDHRGQIEAVLKARGLRPKRAGG